VTFALPLLYARARVEIPSTDIGLEADIKYITTGDSTVYDARAKVDYTLDFVPVIQPALEVGYRAQKIDIDESGVDAKLDIEFSGFYAGLMLRF
jgi:outer membrane protein